MLVRVMPLHSESLRRAHPEVRDRVKVRGTVTVKLIVSALEGASGGEKVRVKAKDRE